jgi:hypothetical protein
MGEDGEDGGGWGEIGRIQVTVFAKLLKCSTWNTLDSQKLPANHSRHSEILTFENNELTAE